MSLLLVVLQPHAYTTPELNLDRSTLNWKKALKVWPNLNEVPPPAPPNCDIGLLLGMDIVNAHLQRRIISPPKGVDDPHAVQTDLDWCVIGPSRLHLFSKRCYRTGGV